MRTIAFALSASIILAHLAGCGGADRAAEAPTSPSGGRGWAGAPNNATSESTVASTRDREVDAAEEAYAKTDTNAPPPPPGTPAPQPPSGAAQPAKARTEAPKDAKDATRAYVIYTARFVMAVYQVDQGISAVERIAKDSGGYLSMKKDREITIRVPRQRFEQAVAAVDTIGDVLHRDIAAQDVTDEHVDLEIRIKNARAMQQQLTALLTRANVKEALEIEKELHRITEELERLEGRLKLLNDKIAFSTITVAFEPRGNTMTTQRPRLPFGWLSGLNLPTLLQLSEDK
ncbi:MAG: DUF4349 domain-containing protein [Labilithrix sp.]|nr:DUF4349 domain-containing protein [Labilithrix sp.]MCW5810129.1 DUF4349 domain-containing protein [Labilithrix sp.]